MLATRSEAEILRCGLFDMQVCVPAAWGDRDIIDFAERRHPCGTANGWQIRREGDPGLAGCPERNPCSERDGFVHVMLDA